MFKRIVLGILITLVVLVLGFVGVVAMQPAEFQVERKATISAPPAAVFAQVNDFHKWEAWSPWEKLDPDCRYTFAGAPEGVGSIFIWSGNDEVGEGRMTILESRPSELIKIKLEFLRPFESAATTTFTFKGDGDQTDVTWKMVGQNSFVCKAFCLFMDMDKMVGGDFEKGLASMKSVVEAKK